MSNETSAVAIAELRTDLIESYCEYAISTLVLYEYLLTIRQEIRFVWKRNFGSAEAIFLCNRFLVVMLSVLQVISDDLSKQTKTGCDGEQVLFFVIDLLCFAVWAVFSALRVYALSGRGWRLAIVVLLLGLVPVGANTFNDIDTAIVYSFPGTVCYDSPKFTSKTYTMLVSTTRTCMILSDMIVVAVTWFHTYKTRKAAQAANIQSSVANLLLRDGTFYFVILALLNATHMSLAITGVFTFLTVFSVPISSIIISRFLLNLRQVDASRRDANWSMPSYVASTTSGATGTFPRGDFVSFLTGNMGKSLDHNPQDELTELDEEFSSGRHYPATPPATPSEC